MTLSYTVLVTLSYVIKYCRGIGMRVGVGHAIQRLGPLLALPVGAWLVGVFRPQMTFALLAMPMALSLVIAFSLPKARGEAAKRGRILSLAHSAPIGIVCFLQG